MESIKPCAICGETPRAICLCGGIPTMIHTCVNEIEIKIKADTKNDVIRKWNTFVTIVNK